MNLVSTSAQDIEQLSTLLRLLGDKTRLNIVILLSAGERNVTELCETLALPQPTVSHHLGLLRINHVIDNRRNGKQVFYALSGTSGVGRSRGMSFDAGKFRFNIQQVGSA